ncbi:hypothetical protein [Roseomonas xinghualingensis]|uniref:hypothetical protein n=1 Tax=Roseomonas xinghualingensis TaxID=2986475 RepID=UPI0021F1DCF7|nr:hypothetical protein [Roseomonas sp. SXEYE001]MCV4209997.1 hypothetical protein [Roseomonas sp. SXEYE001]
MPDSGGAEAKIDIVAILQRLEDRVNKIDTDVAAAKQQTHDVKGYQQQRIAADVMAARLPPASPAPAAAPTTPDVPVWLKIAGALTAFTAATAAILGIVWNAAISPTQTRIDVLERTRTEISASLVAMTTRMQTLEARQVQTDTQMATATRIRDQQIQALQDQNRVLSQADQAGTERIAQLAQTIAGLLPRVEEILRRQERLESRLSLPMPRNGMDDETPAFFEHPERHI